MPIYEITTKGEDAKRLVKADSAAQAIRHCAHDRFSARTISRVEEAADLIIAGVKVETTGTEPPASPEQERNFEPQLPPFIRHGDEIEGLDAGGPYPARINVKAKLVEIKCAGDWATLREATEEELAAEAERTAK